MNFIGHAAVALYFASAPERVPGQAGVDPAYVLGSMLPDFATMAGVRMASPLSARVSPGLAAGVALHHRTDEVFHAAPAFVALQQSTLDTLTARGVPRGSARAVAHIGVELLIDGELLEDRQLADAYRRAIEAEVVMDGVFPTDEATQRYALLRTRLSEHGVPYDYREPDAVLRRLHYILSARPRLAIAPEFAPHVRQLLPSLQREVRAALPALLASVQSGLS